VPEATHHAGTANVTSAITATSATAMPRRVIQLLSLIWHLPVLVPHFLCTHAESALPAHAIREDQGHRGWDRRPGRTGEARVALCYPRPS
jgi:hypothetical protein